MPAQAGEADPSDNVLFVGDFENGFKGWRKREARVDCREPEIVTRPVRAGKHAMKSYVRHSEKDKKSRSEVADRTVKTGEVRWYAFSIYLPEDYQPDETWELFAQWHAAPGRGRNPVLALNAPGSRPGIEEWEFSGRWWVVNRWAADRGDGRKPDGSRDYGGTSMWPLERAKAGEWTDFVFHVKWSYKEDGILQVWQNGKLTIDYRGPNTFNDAGTYFKMGIYKGGPTKKSIVTERVVYNDEFRMGGPNGTYEDVAPPGGEAARIAASGRSAADDRP
jgi:hypothetical protein